ncbi:putative bifunctional diguanylate cyclase/phosphodiesterase [Alkalilimnicola sp. S0819]|uniref:putative bifunctional diguanylate cyclase/phosphodiesterase n=1 Tax=Alkalilimnicola sp. S0819 TaxID=2613922 RepID=UPI0012622D3B|nr:EAL domain-containing protein [Alkalilimnicola sp. S0819]KAB7627589.1 EAL domain-containing protein [Alkalilimnicola sp. S0819]MPQ15751.1 EAL domain-containing protein [Alkalilimnicola sp. S0819]
MGDDLHAAIVRHASGEADWVNALWKAFSAERCLDTLLRGLLAGIRQSCDARAVSILLVDRELRSVIARGHFAREYRRVRVSTLTVPLKKVLLARLQGLRPGSVLQRLDREYWYLPEAPPGQLHCLLRLQRPRSMHSSEQLLRVLAAPAAAALERAHEIRRNEAAHRQLSRVLEQLPATIWTTDTRMRITTASGRGLTAQGLNAEQVIGQRPTDLLPLSQADTDPLPRMLEHALRGQSVSNEGWRGGRRYQRNVEPLRDDTGRIIGCLGVSVDITEQHNTRQALAGERRWAERILASISEGVISVDRSGRVRYANPAAARLCGLPLDSMQQQPIHEVLQLRRDAGRPEAAEQAWETLSERPARRLLCTAPGQDRWVDVQREPLRSGQGIEGDVVLLRDITLQQALARQLAFEATHDPLTGAPNRSLLADRLEQALAGARRNGKRLAVCFLDLDRFKQVNDTLGHETGDELLRQVAERLKQVVRRNDTVSRYGGDEFVLLLEDPGSAEQLADLAQELITRIAAPYQANGHQLHITTSMGISLYPDDAEQARELVKHADIAMYHAKEQGRNGFVYFTADMNRRAREHLFLETALREAMEQGRLSLHYQPRLHLRSRRLLAAEALLRWVHPRRGAISPARFIPVAEDSGLILSLGEQVLHHACAQMRAWADAGKPPIRVAVNVSPVQFRHESLLEQVRGALREFRVPAGRLELEVTEGVFMGDTAGANDRLRELKALGVRLAVDDFGTGYSSLSYLKRFPVDALKIDKTFIRQIPGNKEDAAIARAIIRLGASLGMEVVAEGVETAAAARWLRSRGCYEAQGYYFGYPVPAAEFHHGGADAR